MISKVLIVEDQPGVAKALRMLFDLHDIESTVATKPAEALKAVAGGEVGVVLQDMNFTPGQTEGEEGIDLFRRVRALDPTLPILLITAWTSLETAVQLVKEGAVDYMAKPWNDAKLASMVRALLRARELDEAEKREQLRRPRPPGGIIYASEKMHGVVSLATRVARSDVPVLITGPSGAGKEKIAQIIHASSNRKAKPLVKVNAAAIPDQLIESELFGAEPGAFTGATRLRVGRFEAANGGTIFLDEIGNLSPAGQMKLLRVLQSGELERLGSSETRRIDVRILSATNADLQQAIARGTFRQDLYFRIAVVEIAVPPLRQRRDDILPMAAEFLGGRPLDDAARAALLAHDWPGNVRELQNRAQRALALNAAGAITPDDLGFGSGAAMPKEDAPAERTQIEQALLHANGSISRAAEALGLSRQALYRKMEKLGIVLERRPR